MAATPVLLREQARRDVEQAIGYYLDEAGEKVALGIVDALQAAYRALAERPAAGSSRYAVELDLPGLRSIALHGCPYLVFYMEAESPVQVWRVLHAHRDIPSEMR